MSLLALAPEIEAMLGPTAQAGHRAVAPPVVVSVPSSAGGENAMGGFEGANEFDSSMTLWDTPMQSADADILPDKDIGEGRIRSLQRNDAYVQGGAALQKDNIVGAQFMLNARPATRLVFGKDDDVWEEEFQTEIEEMFDLYADSPDNWIDASRSNNFTQLIRMGVGIHLMSGEILAAAEWDSRSASEFNTCIQMIDLDRLSTDPMSRMDPAVRAGIRFDKNGAPESYQIRTEHPNDIAWSYTLPEWKEIKSRKPWGRPQIIHVHEQVRPQQTRGYSDIMASVKAMHIGHKMRDITLQRILAQSIYAATITSELPSEQVFAQLGGAEASPEQVAKAISGYATGYLSSIAAYTGSAKNVAIDGAKIPHLFPGTKLDLTSPGKDTTLGMEFEQSLLRYMASSFGVSYEQFSRDYTKTNYSSARAAMVETWKYMQSKKKAVADRFATIIFRLWLEEAINNNKLTTLPARKAGMFYNNGVLNMKFDAVSRVEWIGASRGQIDEYKETQAAVLRIDNGLSTAEDELARLGKDWRKVYRQLKREQNLRENLGLLFTPSTTAIVATNDQQDAADADERKEAA